MCGGSEETTEAFNQATKSWHRDSNLGLSDNEADLLIYQQ